MKKLVGMICVLCAVTVLLALSTAAAAESGWREAYRKVLDEIVKAGPLYRNDAAIENSYLLYDVDKDGTPELIIKTGTCEADYMGTLYTFRDGEARKIDEFGFAVHAHFKAKLSGVLAPAEPDIRAFIAVKRFCHSAQHNVDVGYFKALRHASVHVKAQIHGLHK